MNKKRTGFASGLVVVLLVGWQLFFGDGFNTSKNQTNSDVSQEQVIQDDTTENGQTNQQSADNQAGEVPSFTNLTKAKVAYTIETVDLKNPPRFTKIAVSDIRSVDGDTFVIYSNGSEIRLRMLMVDTPESVKKGMPVQPFGKEASNYTKNALKKGDVSIAFDKGEVKDQYDRYLAYVFVGSDSLQGLLLENGLGVVRYVNTGGDTYQKDFLNFQQKAQNNSTAAWSQKDYIKKTKRYYYFDYGE